MCRKKAIFIGGCEVQIIVDGNSLSFGGFSLLSLVTGIRNSPVTRPAGAIRLHEVRGVSPESHPAGGQSSPSSGLGECYPNY